MWLRLSICVVLIGATLAPMAPAAKRPRLDTAAAVPGQVVTVTGTGLRRAKVTIGGKRAAIVRRTARRLAIRVPNLKPGRKAVVVRRGGRRQRLRLRVRRPLGDLRLLLDKGRAASAPIGPGGGTVAATAAGGARLELVLPAGAVAEVTQITLTPAAQVKGLGKGAIAVQLAPEGLRLGETAELRITPALPLRNAVGFSYGGTGSDVEFTTARRVGSSVVVPVEHFSGAGAAQMTRPGFDAVMARLLSADLTLRVAGQFYATVRSVPREWCTSSVTCDVLWTEVQEFLSAMTVGNCIAEAGAIATVLEGEGVLTGLLRIEGDRQLLGLRAVTSLERCREEVTRVLVGLVQDGARSDPLGVSGACAGVAGDLDSDGRVREVECAIHVARTAAHQGFTTLQAAATGAALDGLAHVIDVHLPRCDSPGTFADALRTLEQGARMAAGVGVMNGEFAAALASCTKVTVTPATASVEVGESIDFTAAGKDPADTAFTWSTSHPEPAIDAAGHFVAPDAPGTITVVARPMAHPDRQGTATVTVTCPAGEVEHQDECKALGISINPMSATVPTGQSRQFIATVSNSDDTRVTWSRTGGGSITTGGLFTAPETTGDYTVTATSVADPAKQATAQVHVIREYDLGLTIAESADPATGTVAYDLTAFNYGPSSAPGVTLTIGVADDPLFACTSEQAGEIGLGTIAAGSQSVTAVNVTCDLDATVTITGTLASSASGERDATDNTATETTVVSPVPSASVTFVLEEANPTPNLASGETNSVRSYAINEGDAPANGVSFFVDMIVNELNSTGTGTCSGGGTISFGAVGPGETVEGPTVSGSCILDGGGTIRACLRGLESDQPDAALITLSCANWNGPP